MPKVHLNNIDVYYEVHGKGYPLILVSGLSGNTMSWMTILNTLSRHFKVVIFDNRGAGQASAPDEAYSILQMVEDLYGLLKHLGIEKTHILGYSMGGFIAQEFVLKYPEMADKLILYSTAPFFSRRNKQLFTAMYELWKNGVSRETWFTEFYCWIFSRKFFEDETTFEILLQFALEDPYPQSLEGFKGQLYACIGHNTTKRLKSISHETLVLAGAQDILIPPDESKILADNIPNAKIDIIEGTAHSAHIEDRNVFTTTVFEFLK